MNARSRFGVRGGDRRSRVVLPKLEEKTMAEKDASDAAMEEGRPEAVEPCGG